MRLRPTKWMGACFVTLASLQGILCIGQAPSAPPQKAATTPNSSPAQPATPEAFIDQLKETVVFITGKYARQMTVRAQDGSETRQNLEQGIRGTGYLISLPTTVAGISVETTYLVTNKHMIREPGPDGISGLGPYLSEIEVRVNTKNPIENSSRSYETVIVPVMNNAGQMTCFVDTADEDVDLALCPIAFDRNKWNAKTIGPPSFGTLEKFKTAGINETSEILFAGLFASFSGINKNYPVVRHGKLAMLAGERVPVFTSDRAADVYLGDVMSFGGNSGSPVFVRYGGAGDAGLNLNVGYFLLGTMQGYFNASSPVSVQTAALQGVAAENTGIAFIVPAQKIIDILSLSGPASCQKNDIARFLESSNQTKQAFDLYLQVDQEKTWLKDLFWCEYAAHTQLLKDADILHISKSTLPNKVLPNVLPTLPWRLNIKSSVKVDFLIPVAPFGLSANLFLVSQDVRSYTFLIPSYTNPEAEPITIQKASVAKVSFIQ